MRRDSARVIEDRGPPVVAAVGVGLGEAELPALVDLRHDPVTGSLDQAPSGTRSVFSRCPDGLS
jgi:hypothetical protein